MKPSLVAALLFASWTIPAAAQDLSDGWVSEVSLNDAVDAFGDKDKASKGKQSKGGDCDCGPVWTFAADAVFMQRSTPDSLVLIQDPFDPTRNFNADALGFGFTTGWDVAVGRNTENGGLEARFFSIDGWNSAATGLVTPAPGANVQIINSPVLFNVPDLTSVDATYNSELLSLELNLRRQLNDSVRLLGGFRYLELDEHFHADLNNVALLPTTYDTFTRNRLYGAQIGADAVLWCRNRWTIEGLTKLGIYHNSSGQNTEYDTGLVSVTAADTANRAAFVGEMAFTANYCLREGLTLRGGYDLLWLETVALATDQVPATDFVTGSGISADGGAFYHGAFVGLEYRR